MGSVAFVFLQKPRQKAPQFIRRLAVQNRKPPLQMRSIKRGRFTGSPFRQDIQELNWASVVLGIVLVGIEFGYILLYRAGWEISIAPIMINITCAIILITIGIFVYNESLSVKQGIGILCCFACLYLIR